MAKPPLPEPLMLHQWKQMLKKMHCESNPLSFANLVELARTSVTLRIAFDPAWQKGMNREGKIAFYRREVFKLHGINPFFSDDLDDYSSELSLDWILDESLNDVDVWDAVSDVISEIIRDDLPILQVSREWASAVVSGSFSRPDAPSGPHPLKHSARNIMLISFLCELAKFGVPITESETKADAQSACHAVSEALSGYYVVPSPKTLMNIWSSRSQNWKDITRNA